MTERSIPKPEVVFSKSEARRFLLAYHQLWPPKNLHSKEDVIEYFRRVGCIQYDPINAVGRNPDLVLQSRVQGYSPAMLEQMLYSERVLWDGFDKVQSIYLTGDWPYFTRLREHRTQRPWHTQSETMELHNHVLEAIQEKGPLSSIDLDHSASVVGFWGMPMRSGRGALENLYIAGKIGIHHRTGTRRYFDLTERLLPAELLANPDPFDHEQDYQNWHILRRVGGLGLALPSGAESWLGMLNIKAAERQRSLKQLIERGDVVVVGVEEAQDGKVLFTQRRTFETILNQIQKPFDKARAALIAPLDNLLWQRELIRRMFDFDYTWEVYKPSALRQYGFYVLPVLYGERFVARCDLSLDRKTKSLKLLGWWWEPDIVVDEEMAARVADCLQGFMTATGAHTFQLPQTPEAAQSFEVVRPWMQVAS